MFCYRADVNNFIYFYNFILTRFKGFEFIVNLQDAGYGEKSLFAAEDDNDDDIQVKMDDEASWNFKYR